MSHTFKLRIIISNIRFSSPCCCDLHVGICLDGNLSFARWYSGQRRWSGEISLSGSVGSAITHLGEGDELVYEVAL